jgi:hypothetical protein
LEKEKMTFKLWLEARTSSKYMHISNLAKKANLDVTKYNKKEIIDGFETEKEHMSFKKLDVIKGHEERILKIALAHLKEDPKYYTKLKKAKL